MKKVIQGWMRSEEKWLKANAHQLSDKQLAAELGRTVSSIRGKLEELQLRGNRAPELYHQGRFKPGQPQPARRGTKKAAPEGTISQLKRGSSGNRYSFQKVNGQWVRLHLLNWEAAHGPLPANHVLICRTQDTTNADPSNWEAISRAAHVQRNFRPEKAAQSLRELWVVAKALHAEGKQHNSGIGRRVAALKTAA